MNKRNSFYGVSGDNDDDETPQRLPYYCEQSIIIIYY